MIKNEKGNVLVLFAIFLTVLTGILAVMIDLGFAQYYHSKIINTATVASISGAQFLPNNPDLAREKARKVLNDAGLLDNSMIDIINNKITVTINKNVKFFWAPLLNKKLKDINLGIKKTAKVVPVNEVFGLAPLGIKEQNLIFGMRYMLKADDSLGKGWYGALRLGNSSGTNDYRDNLIHGYQGWIKIGDIVEEERGDMVGPTSQGVNELINSETPPYSTVQDYRLNSPRVVKIAILRDLGEKKHQIVGFALFLLDNNNGNGKNGTIYGYFLNQVLSEYVKGGDENIPDYGLRKVILE